MNKKQYKKSYFGAAPLTVRMQSSARVGTGAEETTKEDWDKREEPVLTAAVLLLFLLLLLARETSMPIQRGPYWLICDLSQTTHDPLMLPSLQGPVNSRPIL